MNSSHLHGHSIIAGKVVAGTGPAFHAVNPGTSEKLAPDFHSATRADADRALQAAAAAFAEYRRLPAETRARFLDTIAAEIEALGETLLARVQAETGLPPARLQGERARTCNQLRLFAEVIREGSWADRRIDVALPERKPLPRPDLRRVLLPLGPVVVFGSSNFPLAFSVAGGDTASALAAGCPVVVKGHSAHPGTSELVAGAITKAVKHCGLPPGVFSLIQGARDIGIALVEHPATAAVGFTGSYTAGRALLEAAAARPHPIPVFAEMSSLNPVFLRPDALRTRGTEIAQGLLGSFTMGVGQLCTKPGLVFALRSPETDTFLISLGTLISTAPCATMLTDKIHQAYANNRATVLKIPGVTLAASSEIAPHSTKTEAQPSFAHTTAAHFLKNPAVATEVFGPFTVIVLAETEEEILACARALEGQLTATLHATEADLAALEPLVSILEQKAGRLVFNAFPTGVEVSSAMNHGGPWPATSDVRFTSVGTAAILRFARPVCYQGFPQSLLPPALRDKNSAS